MSAKVAVFGTLRFPPERVEDMLAHLQELLDATRKNDGCLAYDAAVDPFDPGLVRFTELWPDYASLDRHLRAPHIATWRAAARKCGLMHREFTAYDISGARTV